MPNIDHLSTEQFSEPSPRRLLQGKCRDHGDPIRNYFDIGPVRLLLLHDALPM
jgi:hypothetical protein